TTPAATTRLAGQSSLTPSQVSTTSQVSLAARQIPVRLASGGQLALCPLHTSGWSQTPAAGRQSVPPGATASGGQSVAEPSQRSGASHASTAARHTSRLLPSGGQAASVPLQTSAASQIAAAARHTVPADANRQAAVQQPPGGSQSSPP